MKSLLAFGLPACLILLLPISAGAQSPPCPAADPAAGPVRSQYCVMFNVQDGRLAVPDGRDSFTMTADFGTRLRGITLGEAQTSIRQQLGQVLASLSKPYLKALAPGESDASLTDPLSEAVRHFSGTWEQYSTKVFPDWMQANPNRQDLGTVFSSLVSDLLQMQNSLVVNDSSVDPASGFASFSILSPFDARTVNIDLPGMIASRRQQRIPQLRNRLEHLNGDLWSPSLVADIKSSLTSFYNNLGLAPEPLISPRDDKILIIEGQRLASIVLPESEVPVRDIPRILWDLLDTHEFKSAMASAKAWEGSRTLKFHENLGYARGDEPYVVQARLQEQQLLLSQLGYAFTLQPSTVVGPSQYFDLRVQKASSPSSPAEKKPKADAEGVDTKGLARPDREIPKSQQQGAGLTEVDSAKPKDRSRRIAGGFQYKPGQGVSALGLFQLSRIPWPFENGTLSAQGGGPSGNQISGNYFADFVWFNRLRQRVAVRLNGSTELTQNRFLGGLRVDERQTGGLVHIEWEPFRDLAGNLLMFHVDGNRSTVRLEQKTGVVAKQNLSTVEVGGLLLSRSRQAEYPQRTRIDVRVITGLGLAATETSFAHLVAIANHHRSFDKWEYDFTGRFEDATKDTPIFAQPSFGGADVVRGFRADDAVGLRLWSLQSELWHPIPWLGGSSISNRQIQNLLQSLKLAGFFDVGGAYSTVSSEPGTRYGSGLGLRVNLKLALLKFDWAYGIGNAATGGSRGKFYFTVGLNVPY